MPPRRAPPPPPPPMPPEFRRHDDQTQRSSSPPPPPMPTERRRHDDRPQRSSSPPPPPYIPPGRRRHDDQPQRSSSPPPPPYMPPGRSRLDDQLQSSASRFYMPPGRRLLDQRYSWFPYHLPNGQQILAYKDRNEVLFTDHGGPTRPVEDVCREVLSDLSRDPPQPYVGESELKRPEEDQQTPTANPGPSSAGFTKEGQQMATPLQRQYAEQDQTTPQETSTLNPGPSSAQYIEDILNKAFTVHKLDMAQRRAQKDQLAPQQTATTNTVDDCKLEDSQRFLLWKEEMGKRMGNMDAMWPANSRHEDRETHEFLDTSTLDESCIASISPSLLRSLLGEVQDPFALKLHRALVSSSFVSSLVPTGLFIKYFVRIDKAGFYHIYPDRGGPFQNLQKAQEAVDSHHVEQRKMMCMDGLSDEERAVRNSLYWFHDGTRKHSAEAFASITTRRPTWELLKALLDRHNEDNHLLGDHAYELKDIVRHNSCFDGKGCIYRSYSHFNVTMKTKGTEDLYFAEVTCLSAEYEAYVLTCFCMVQPDRNGECLVCEVEMKDLKHPTDHVYNHGRCPPPPMLPVRSCRSKAYGANLFQQLYAVRDQDWLIEEEARVRRILKEGKEARCCKLEVDRGDDIIKEEKATRYKLKVDKMVARRKLELENFLKELRARRS